MRVLPFLIPVLTSDGLLNPKLARALGSALWMYDLTGGCRIGKLHQRVSTRTRRSRTCRRCRADRTSPRAYLYYDAQADDARLTLTIARTAADYGAVVANHAACQRSRKDGTGRVTSARVVDADGDDDSSPRPQSS